MRPEGPESRLQGSGQHRWRRETVDNRGAGIGIALCVLLIKGNGIAELIGQGILEALGRCVKRYVLHELADTDIVRFCLLLLH